MSTDERGARYAGGFPKAVAVETVRSATFARGGRLDRLRVPLRIARGVLSAALEMRRDRPSVVVGFGGYPSIPALAAAWLLQTLNGQAPGESLPWAAVAAALQMRGYGYTAQPSAEEVEAYLQPIKNKLAVVRHMRINLA